jgi:hypothetical protein
MRKQKNNCYMTIDDLKVGILCSEGERGRMRRNREGGKEGEREGKKKYLSFHSMEKKWIKK